MNNLESIKRKARADFNKYAPKTRGCENCWGDLHRGCEDYCNAELKEYGQFFRDLDTFADRLLEEVEKAVVPQELTGGGYDEMAEHQEGYNDCRSEVLEAFAKFKGV